jgi:hypothetical protein
VTGEMTGADFFRLPDGSRKKRKDTIRRYIRNKMTIDR